MIKDAHQGKAVSYFFFFVMGLSFETPKQPSLLGKVYDSVVEQFLRLRSGKLIDLNILDLIKNLICFQKRQLIVLKFKKMFSILVDKFNFYCNFVN